VRWRGAARPEVSGRACAWGAASLHASHWFAPSRRRRPPADRATFVFQEEVEEGSFDPLAIEGLPCWAAKCTSARDLPSLRDQPPCTHGPITKVLYELGAVALDVLVHLKRPKRFSASYQPPTVITAGLMFLMSGGCCALPERVARVVGQQVIQNTDRSFMKLRSASAVCLPAGRTRTSATGGGQRQGTLGSRPAAASRLGEEAEGVGEHERTVVAKIVVPNQSLTGA